jgi:HEAT repeat protein
MSALLLVGLALAAGPAPEPLFAGRPLRQWVKDLGDDDPLVREEAVEVLADAGPAAREAAPALEKMTREGPQRLRLRAALALGRVAGKNGPAVELLARGLRKSPTAADRTQALQTLQQLSADASPAVPAVLECVDAPEPAVRAQAASTLRAIGQPALPAVLDGLEKKDVRERRRAAVALQVLSHLTRDRAPLLRARLADEDLAVRAGCARVLWESGDTSKPVVEVLADAVANGEPELRRDTLAAVTSTLDPVRTPALRPIVERAFQDHDPALRVRAAWVLARMDAKAAVVLPVLVEGLKHKDAAVRSEAVAGLTWLGPRAAPAVPALIERLRGAPGEDFQLTQAFVRIGPAAAGPLVDLIASPKADPARVQSATMILTSMGPAAAPQVLPLLKHDKPQVRGMACQVVGNAGTAAEKVVPPLTERLEDPDAGVRFQAMASLGRLGPAAAAAIPKIIPFSRDPQPNVRTVCLHTLEAIGPDDPAVQPVALAALKDDVAMVRAHGLLLLAAANPRHPDVLPQALDLLKQQPPNLLALNVLQRLGPHAAKAVPPLTAWFRAEVNPGTRNVIAFTLGTIGPAARTATPDLIEMLQQRDLSSRQTALQALRSIGGADPGKLVPALLGVLRDNPGYVRGLALDLLGDQGPAAAEAVPLLLEVLRKPEGADLASAARALGQIAPERARKEGVPLLEKVLQPGPNQIFGARAVCLLDPDHKEAALILRRALRNRNPGQWLERKQAAEAVAEIGPAFRDAAPDLEDVLKDKNPDVRLSAAKALWRTGRDAEKVVPALVDLLRPANPVSVRHPAIQTLKEMGPAAKEARSALRELRGDPDLYVRQQSAEIVRRIDAASGP